MPGARRSAKSTRGQRQTSEFVNCQPAQAPQDHLGTQVPKQQRSSLKQVYRRVLVVVGILSGLPLLIGLLITVIEFLCYITIVTVSLFTQIAQTVANNLVSLLTNVFQVVSAGSIDVLRLGLAVSGANLEENTKSLFSTLPQHIPLSGRLAIASISYFYMFSIIHILVISPLYNFRLLQLLVRSIVIWAQGWLFYFVLYFVCFAILVEIIDDSIITYCWLLPVTALFLYACKQFLVIIDNAIHTCLPRSQSFNPSAADSIPINNTNPEISADTDFTQNRASDVDWTTVEALRTPTVAELFEDTPPEHEDSSHSHELTPNRQNEPKATTDSIDIKPCPYKLSDLDKPKTKTQTTTKTPFAQSYQTRSSTKDIKTTTRQEQDSDEFVSRDTPPIEVQSSHAIDVETSRESEGFSTGQISAEPTENTDQRESQSPGALGSLPGIESTKQKFSGVGTTEGRQIQNAFSSTSPSVLDIEDDKNQQPPRGENDESEVVAEASKSTSSPFEELSRPWPTLHGDGLKTNTLSPPSKVSPDSVRPHQTNTERFSLDSNCERRLEELRHPKAAAWFENDATEIDGPSPSSNHAATDASPSEFFFKCAEAFKRQFKGKEVVSREEVRAFLRPYGLMVDGFIAKFAEQYEEEDFVVPDGDKYWFDWSVIDDGEGASNT